MRHPGRVDDYLEHITEAISRAVSYLRPLPDPGALRENRQVQDAIVRNIEIIGKASARIQRVAPDFIEHNPHIPWAQMRPCVTW